MTDAIVTSIEAALEEIDNANLLMLRCVFKTGRAYEPDGPEYREPLEAAIRLAGNAENCLRRYRENICLVVQLLDAQKPPSEA